ncbi:hypothetical protein Gotri_024558 [Gossypium trilobum]|uniref:Mitoferrin-like n=1 Tax=Gossypium trilobum TaxID=34281 RepID=A0A7J9DMV2_9ROSI|nr:hypothetical protein [Gossypium trilobum]
MSTEAAATNFQSSDFQPVAQPPDFRPEVTVSPHDGLRFWQFMIAGSIAGCVEHMAMFPVDTVKTHMQALGSCPIKSVGVHHALRSILKSEGVPGLYRGIGAMGLGAGPAHAVYFSVYEVCKKYFSGGDPNNSAAHAVSGVFATVASDAVFTPMDMVKQRLQLGNSATYRGVLDCVRRVLKEEGFGAFYASYRTTSASDERVIVHATAGALAGASAAVVTTPLDVVKTQLQCQGVCGCDRFKSSSISDVIKTIVKKDGYKGLMRGWIPRMFFHAPAAAICWSTYEAAKTFFQELNASRESGSVT